MKTLREQLMQRSESQASEPALDAMRARVRAELRRDRDGVAAGGAGPSGPLEIFRVAWRELLWPCRGLWAGLAAAWVVVLALNHSGRPEGSQASLSATEIAALHGLWREQQSLLAALTRASAGASNATTRGLPEPDSSELRRPESDTPISKPLGWLRAPGGATGELILT